MKKLISLLASLAILALVYSRLEAGALVETLLASNKVLILISLLLLMALIVLSGLRLRALGLATGMNISPRQAMEATFVANALNLFLPGKMGDVLKASSLAGDDFARLPQALVIGVWEKLSELTLLLWIGAFAFAIATQEATAALGAAGLGMVGLGLLLYWPPLPKAKGRMAQAFALWSETLRQLRASGLRTASILALSLLIWLGHIIQICMMAAALGVEGSMMMWFAIGARLPIGVLAGLVPLTFMGLGTRDATMILLLEPFMGKEKAAALGVLFLLRYLVPGIVSLPFLPRFWHHSGAHLREIKQAMKR